MVVGLHLEYIPQYVHQGTVTERPREDRETKDILVKKKDGEMKDTTVNERDKEMKDMLMKDIITWRICPTRIVGRAACFQTKS